MASDLLVGLVLGVFLMGVFNPYKGLYFAFRQIKRENAILRENSPVKTSDFPNRKENS